ncbi:MAG: precorrin-6y C5,15-methyltransferase (decarboxylating) subunit CbiE [Chloroflexi bacterium]|nr:precorrin-6y C5,15-methyltransferase (decarboxylating) subunit CbiE [Chloroflexota bacterium]
MNSLLSRITVLGIADGEPMALALRDRVVMAELIAGGARHLAHFPDARGERFVIGNNIAELVARLRGALAGDESAVVLASGDPLLYGIGATLRRHFAAEQLEIIPAVSSVQRAFAALGEPWHDALLLTAHGRPGEAVIAALTPLRKAAILTDAIDTPARLAGLLLNANGDCPAAVCERLGTPEQRLRRGTLSEIAHQTFDPLNVMVLLPEASPPDDSAFGVPDEALEHDGLITHLEVRAVSIAYLRG